MLVPVILVGGSGSRLAPISTPDHPKPFIDLLNTGESLFQATIRRAQAISHAQPIILGASEHESLIRAQLAELKANAHLILEPCARNTAPAVATAALFAQIHYGDQVTLLVMPADHYVGDLTYFTQCIQYAHDHLAPNKTTIFGVTPTTANTHYGYIQYSGLGLFQSFTEKPDLATAQHYLKSKRYLWNSGFFLTSPSHFLSELNTYHPNTVKAVMQALDTNSTDQSITYLSPQYQHATSISVDYAILEHSQHIDLIEYQSGWSDLGTWQALYEQWPKQKNIAYHSGLSLSLTPNTDKLTLYKNNQWIADV